MAVKIKLKRLGKIREPYYRIVVADARTKRDGRAIEEIGKYHPKAEPSLIEVNSERAQHWLSVGAQPTDPVRALLKITGDWQKFTGEAGAEGTLRTARLREDKKERFEAAAKESQASKEAKEDRGTKAATQSRAARPAKDTAAKDTAAKDTAGQGHRGQGHRGQGHRGQGHQPGQGHRGQGHRGQGHRGQGHRGQGHRGQGNQPGQGHPGQGHRGQGKPGQGKPGQGKRR